MCLTLFCVLFIFFYIFAWIIGENHENFASANLLRQRGMRHYPPTCRYRPPAFDGVDRHVTAESLAEQIKDLGIKLSLATSIIRCINLPMLGF